MSYKPFEHLEHTADILIVSRGSSLEEAFANAAKAVFEVITDTSRVEPRKCVDVEVKGMDIGNLLYLWIDRLLYYFDAEGLVFSRFKVNVAEEGGGYLLKGEACGEEFDPEKHEYRTIVKAMTYAQMNIEREEGVWSLKFVVDI